MRLFRLLLWCSVLAVPGCYTYTPLALDAVQEGTIARVRVSAVEAARLQETVPVKGRVAVGMIVEAGGQALLLDIPSGVSPAAQYTMPLHQRIRISHNEVLEVEVRQLDRWKTGALATVGAVVVGVVVARQFGGGQANSNLPPGGNGPAEIVLPVSTLLQLLPSSH